MKKSSPMAKYSEIGNRRHVRNKLITHDDPVCIPKRKAIETPLQPRKQVISVGRSPIFREHGPSNPYFIPIHRRYFNKTIIQRETIPDPSDNTKLKTIVDDVHGEYFKIVEGRSLRPNKDIKVFMANIRQICLHNADIAYLNDQSLRIDYRMTFGEMQNFRETYTTYEKVLSNYQKFLNHSLKRAQQAVERSEKRAAKVAEMKERFENYNVMYRTLKGQIIVLIDKIELLKKYKHFLMKLSPIWWRLEHGVGFLGKSVTAKKIFMEDSDSESNDHETDLSSIENKNASEIVVNLSEGALNVFFENPQDLMTVLDDMAFRCNRYIVINAHNDVTILKGVLKARDYLRNETVGSEAKFLIKNYEDSIKYFEAREIEVRTKFFKVLFDFFQGIITSEDYVKLYADLFFINKKVLGNLTDKSDSIADLMKQIEQEYFNTSLVLESMDYNIVKRVTKECHLADIKLMKNAYAAQRQLREWALYEKALHASFDPPRYRYKKR